MDAAKLEEALKAEDDQEALRRTEGALKAPNPDPDAWLELAITNNCPMTAQSLIASAGLDEDTVLDVIYETLSAGRDGNIAPLRALQALPSPIEAVGSYESQLAEESHPSNYESFASRLVRFWLEMKAQNKTEMMNEVADVISELSDTIAQRGISRYAHGTKTPSSLLRQALAMGNDERFEQLLGTIEPGPETVGLMLEEGYCEEARRYFCRPHDETIDWHDPDQRIPDSTDEDRRFQILQAAANNYDHPSLSVLFEGPDELRELLSQSTDRQSGLITFWFARSLVRNGDRDGFRTYMPVLYDEQEYSVILKAACDVGGSAPEEAVELIERILQHGQDRDKLSDEVLEEALSNHLTTSTPRTGRVGSADLVECFYDHGYTLNPENDLGLDEQRTRTMLTADVVRAFIECDDLTNQQQDELFAGLATNERKHPVFVNDDIDVRGLGQQPPEADDETDEVTPVEALIEVGYHPKTARGYGRTLRQIWETYDQSHGTYKRFSAAQSTVQTLIEDWTDNPRVAVEGEETFEYFLTDVDLTQGAPEANRFLVTRQLLRAGWTPDSQSFIDDVYEAIVSEDFRTSQRLSIIKALAERNFYPTSDHMRVVENEEPAFVEAIKSTMDRRQQQSLELID